MSINKNDFLRRIKQGIRSPINKAITGYYKRRTRKRQEKMVMNWAQRKKGSNVPSYKRTQGAVIEERKKIARAKLKELEKKGIYTPKNGKSMSYGRKIEKRTIKTIKPFKRRPVLTPYGRKIEKKIVIRKIKSIPHRRKNKKIIKMFKNGKPVIWK